MQKRGPTLAAATGAALISLCLAQPSGVSGATVGTIGGQRQQQMPSRLQLQERWPWVSARTLTNRSTADVVNVIYEGFPERRRPLRDYLSKTVPAALAAGRDPECMVVPHGHTEYPVGFKAVDSLADWVSNARAIFEASVVGIEGGFFGGVPEILVKVEVRDWLKRDPVLYPKAHKFMYFLYPVGVFPLGEGSICLTSSADWPGLPEVGARVLFAAQRFAFGPDANVIIPLPVEVAFEDRQRVAVPGELRKVFARAGLERFERLLTQTRDLAAGEVQ